MHPHVPASRLHGLPDGYKIKLRASGFRLVYLVHDKVLVVTVIGVGKREKRLVYLAAKKRL
jgi:mRNA interferase RelE/StbE